ncbi:GAF domain-containing protein, partial [Staphylococcus cohnii]
PIFVNNTIIGVLDIDAPTINRFNKNDELNLQNIVELIEKKLAKIDLSIMTDVSTNFIKK